MTFVEVQVTDLMNEAIDIYENQINTTKPAAYREGDCLLTPRRQVNVQVVITSGGTELKLDTDEKYKLAIITEAPSKTSVYIKSYSFFGARHALETLSQLIVWDETISALLVMKNVEIRDSPAFPHRGLLIDTARNYISVAMIKK